MSTTTQERLEAAVKNLQSYADEVDAAGAAPSGEQLGELKNRMEEVKNLKAAVTAEAEARGEIAEAHSFLKSLSGTVEETKAAPRESVTLSGLPMDTQGKTFGELFVDSPAYKEFVGRFAGRDGVIPNSMKNIQSGPFQTPDLKALLTGASATSAGAAVRNDLYAPITDLVGERELTIRDIITIGSTTSDTVEYVRTTSKTNSAAPVAEATSSAAPTVTVDGNAQSGVALVNNAGGGYKPESSVALEVVSAAVKTIAHWMPLTKRAAADAPQVRTLVDNFLRYGLLEELEDQIVAGSGSGENFTGILSTSGIQTTGSAGTDIDAIVDAIRKIRVTGRRRPTAMVIHPNDWYSTGFLLAKTGDGTNSSANYLIGDPRASIDQLNQLWGLQVVVSEAVTENTALVGDFRQAVLWEREGVSLMVSDQHADFFTRNLLAVLAEMRAAFGVLDPEGFCTVTAV
jgi:HK97 family phage major capsid protein